MTILPNDNFISQNRFVNSAISARAGMLRDNHMKSRKRRVTKSAVALLKDVRQLGCVFRDAVPPESLSILRKSTRVLGLTRRVRFTKATQRHANIRKSKGPSPAQSMEFIRRKLDLIITDLKTMVKRSIEQNLRIKNFEARNGNYERKRRGQESGDKTAWTKNFGRLLAMENHRAVF